MSLRRRTLAIVRRIPLSLGLAAALYFMLIGATGVALNHRQLFRLEDRYVSRIWLPESYRPQDGAEVRADILVGDLHSGLIFGRFGSPIMDVVATSGFFLYSPDFPWLRWGARFIRGVSRGTMLTPNLFKLPLTHRGTGG